MLGALSACGLRPPEGEDKLRVVSTIFAPYDFARAVGGELAQVTMLLPPAGESHSFEPTPQDIMKIRNCDVFIYVGGESDAWVERILSGMDTSGMQVVTLMDCVETVEEELAPGMQHDEHDHEEHEEHDEHEEAELDEHVWTSPKNAGLITQKIAAAMSAADPQNAIAYEQNTAAYLVELNNLDEQLHALANGAARNTIAFGDRFPFRYLVDAYDLDYYAAFPGCSAETEASVDTVITLIELVQAEGIPVVFHTELSNQSMAKVIAGETGARVRMLHACHNITRADFAAGKTYLQFMADNIAALREALY